MTHAIDGTTDFLEGLMAVVVVVVVVVWMTHAGVRAVVLDRLEELTVDEDMVTILVRCRHISQRTTRRIVH